MYDEIDDYIERSLKNWVARYQPPAGDRWRLLQAATEPVSHNPSKISQLLTLLINPNNPFERTIYPRSEWEVGPAFSSMVCALHFASSWRIAH